MSYDYNAGLFAKKRDRYVSIVFVVAENYMFP
jgi:hypothetical protein